MRSSTKALMAKHGWRIDRAFHNYLYFSFYYPYVRFIYHGLRLISQYLSWFKPLKPILRMSFDRYHAKVISFSDVRKFLTLHEDINIDSEQNKRIIPFAYAYRILFEEADFIAVMDCPCKMTLKAPAWTINSCLSIGRKTSQFWLDHCGEKYHARRISPEDALDLIRKFRQHGYITQAFFKVATGGSTGIICNCHPDTCVSLQATSFARRFSPDLTMNADSGYATYHRDEACRHCGTCAQVCHFGAIQVTEQDWIYDRTSCMGCGLCTEHCPEQALSLYRDANKTVPLDLDMLKAGELTEEGADSGNGI
ncbi:MAG TPA: 4Fe-4S binding protein [Smithellaceae bacterium]|nr:4Fe-4S binding protein [Smithellaceae bacterium]HPN87433.1 4Fe-4S binding protein [Smithella sp.]HPV50400.1 4Fe-4S binding protein [Smithellaceae bacterium]HQI23594.1 4Fe-4S binding protein [Smithella sp.]